MLNIFNNYKLHCLLIGLVFILTACGARKISTDAPIQLNYLDEYIIPKDFEVENTKVGGLSDLDFDGQSFYTIVDLPASPRIYQFTLNLKDNQIDTLYFEKLIPINRKENGADSLFWDSEGLVHHGDSNQFVVSSEGSIKSNKNPFVAEVDAQGKLQSTYSLPSYFKANTSKGLRNNGVFEGLTQSVDQKGIWVATELPMKRDGPRTKLYRTKSPIRITYFDSTTKEATKQFAYKLDRIRKFPLLPFAINGVSAIWEYQPGLFIVLERAFSAGHGSKGFEARLYLADARKATNTLKRSSLKGKIDKSIIPAKKKLLFDFRSIRSKLSRKTTDNLEGIAPGPRLPNGNQSILLISDNNFSSWTAQLNQLILMELIEN